MSLVRITIEEVPTKCYRCGGNLVLRRKGLYCPRCSRFRMRFKPLPLELKNRGGGVWSFVNVRQSGREKRRVHL